MTKNCFYFQIFMETHVTEAVLEDSRKAKAVDEYWLLEIV